MDKKLLKILNLFSMNEEEIMLLKSASKKEIGIMASESSETNKQVLDYALKNNVTLKDAIRKIKIANRNKYLEKQKQDIQNLSISFDDLYDVIVIDPPWPYGTKYDPFTRRVANPYPEMSIEEIKNIKLPVKDDSVLFLWTTHRFIWDSKDIMDAYGFSYIATLVWDKQKIGMGSLFRMQCEFCIVGKKGKPVIENDFKNRDIIRESRREHSRKPETFYTMVDKMFPMGKKLDYFSRESRIGWHNYGNETDKFKG